MGSVVDQLADLIDTDWIARGDRHSQGVGHCVLAFPGGHFKNLDVHPVGHFFAVTASKHVIGDSELTGRKHFFTVLVIGKCSRLADQRIDDVTIVDAPSMLTVQTGHCLDVVSLVCHDDLFGSKPHIDFLTDQPTGYGIGVRSDLDRATLGNANPQQVVIGVESMIGQPV